MKIRILTIAPYLGMKELINDIAGTRDDVEMTVHIGNLEKGLEIVSNCDLDDYDIILSRGGTARMIAAQVNVPVVEVNISVYDVLRAIKLAENYNRSFAIIGYPAITDCARLLCNLLKYNIEIVTINERDDAYTGIQKLKEKGYELVLCDMIGTTVAHELGVNFVLITSGRESIDIALNQAVTVARLYSYNKQQALVLKTAIVQSRESLFIYTKEGELIFSSMERSSATELFFEQVEQNLPSFLSDPRFRVNSRVESLVFTLYSRNITIHSVPYVYIYLLIQDAPVLINDLGVSLYNTNNTAGTEESDFYGSAILVGNTKNTMVQYASTLCPLLILGESGTGKDKTASFLYEHSEYKNGPFFIIDCEQTNQKKWNYLMENVNSPLNDLHTTIYIKNFQKLEDHLASRFLSYLNQSEIHKRNRLIFSYTLTRLEEEQDSKCQLLINSLSFLVLRLQPLRERKEDIPGISTLYINQANAELGRQVVGFEPEAMNLMIQFGWEHNLAQLKRIIRQLIVATKEDYICADKVQQMLKQESPQIQTQAAPGYELVNTRQSLEEINHDIVRLVMKQEGGSKTKTAERLGISRSTLWRILNK